MWTQEQAREYQIYYYLRNKERLLAQQKVYNKKNWEKIKPKMVANIKKWRINNPEKYKEIVARKQARKILEKLSHPEIWHQLPSGRVVKWKRKSKYANETPEQKQLRIREYKKRYEQNPEHKEKHRIIARNYMRRKAQERKENLERIEREKIRLLGKK